MKISIESRAKRILSAFDSYIDDLNNPIFKKVLNYFKLNNNEKIIGIYFNNTEDIEESILITDYGLHLFKEKNEIYFEFSKISKIQLPEYKTQITGFTIILKDNKSIQLPVKGVKRDKFYDAFEFIRFINRVIYDLNCNS